MAKVKFGSVHGRFQPFHNGHFDYVQQAFDRAEFIYVGLTQLLRPTGSISTNGRDAPSSNPLSYWERSLLIEAAFKEAGIDRERFAITPFPIEDPARLTEFIPLDVTCFTTVVNQWNNEKIERLRSQGYTVSVLDISFPDNVRVTSGTDIRRLLRANDPSWARFVSAAVGEIISTELRHRF